MIGQSSQSAAPLVEDFASLRRHATDFDLLTDPKGALTEVEFHLTDGRIEHVSIPTDANATTTVEVDGEFKVRVLSLLRWEQM